jgi:phytoene synthase
MAAPDPAETLDALVRRVDPDRWLASRFVTDADRRADVIAIYALNYELARIPDTVSQPMLGEIRMAWWREALDEIVEGRPARRHPAADALALAVDRRSLSRPILDAMIDARERDLNPAPLSPLEVEPYLRATAGGVMALVAQALAPGVEAGLLQPAALAWGIAGLRRLERLPPEWSDADVRDQVDAALKVARESLRALPPDAFPAVAYAGLALAYAAGRQPGELIRRLILLRAVLTGRI